MIAEKLDRSPAFLRFFIYVAVGLFASVSGWAWDGSPQCYKQLELDFFYEPYLDETFSMHYIDQGDWNAIYRDLKFNVQGIHSVIWANGAKLGVNNPLDYPFQPIPAAQLMLQALYKVFVQTLHGHNITNDNDIYNMFAYVINKQEGRLTSCFGQPIKFKKDEFESSE